MVHTYYVLDGGAQVEGTTLTVTALGSHTLSFWSVDTAGNIESAHVVNFTVAAPAPAPTPTPGDGGGESHYRHHPRPRHHAVRDRD